MWYVAWGMRRGRCNIYKMEIQMATLLGQFHGAAAAEAAAAAAALPHCNFFKSNSFHNGPWETEEWKKRNGKKMENVEGK